MSVALSKIENFSGYCADFISHGMITGLIFNVGMLYKHNALYLDHEMQETHNKVGNRALIVFALITVISTAMLNFQYKDVVSIKTVIATEIASIWLNIFLWEKVLQPFAI